MSVVLRITEKNRYRELLRVSRIWRLLKLLKWQGFHGNSTDPDLGSLCYFARHAPNLE